MAAKIIWSPTAVKSYIEIQNYIIQNWGVKGGELFESKVLIKLDQLILFPKSAPLSKKNRSIRKAVISKQTSILYKWRPIKNELELLVFWDNRRRIMK